VKYIIGAACRAAVIILLLQVRKVFTATTRESIHKKKLCAHTPIWRIS
jgi:hypothetical protein